MRLLANWLLSAISVMLVSSLVPGFRVDGLSGALFASLVIGLLNAVVRPFLLLLTLPINLLTLGLFTFVLNALLLILASTLSPGFHVDGFGAAFLGSILLSVVTTILHSLVK
ncbi:MAG: phage holin family protein [bacterium]|nr:phage holin family protein [bacterium]